MKQRIRLTESDLRNIVREAINELDWKTYASAAKKRAMQGDPKGTVNDLSRAATMALRTKYPTSEHPSIETYNDDYHGHRQVGRVPALGEYNPYDGTPCDTYVDNFDIDGVSSYATFRQEDELQKDMKSYFDNRINEVITRAIRKYLR